ncbi:MAG: amidohydrolase [Rhodothermales bacterium]
MRHAILALLVLSLATSPVEPPPADIIYVNAVIWTGDREMPIAEALAVSANRFSAVGTRDEIESWRGPDTKVVDVEGRLLVPGFIDNHVHFLEGGLHLGSLNLRTAHSPDEFARRVERFARTLPRGRWITGGEWDHEMWGGELPRRDWIDSVTVANPVFVTRLDGHMGLANSLALELAGIDRDTPDPVGGLIVRDPESGEATGVLKDESMSLVSSIIPPPSTEDEDAALDRAMTHALQNGVTQVHDMGSFGGWTDLAVYRRARDAGSLRIRIYSFVPLATWPRLLDFVRQEGRGDDWLRWGGLKGFVDGSLGSTTAWFHEPFTDAPETSGLVVTDTSDLREWIVAADKQDLRLAVHAIGDRANDWLLDVFQDAVRENGGTDRRFRVEHSQHLSPEAIPRFGTDHIIPSMQPYHAIDDGRWAEKRIGSERIRRTYAFRSLQDAGARLTFGSDWTVAPLSPIEGIYAAVTRRTTDGLNPDGWVKGQKISIEDALGAYTAANAFAGFQEDRLGMIKPGYLADFVVLSENLFEIPPEEIINVNVIATIVDGRVMYEEEAR